MMKVTGFTTASDSILLKLAVFLPCLVRLADSISSWGSVRWNTELAGVCTMQVTSNPCSDAHSRQSKVAAGVGLTLRHGCLLCRHLHKFEG
jgi:hypothetical protein